MCVIRELFGVYLKVAPRAGGEVLEMPIVVLNALGGMNRAFSRRRLQISSSVGRKEREEVYLEGKVLVSTSSLYVPRYLQVVCQEYLTRSRSAPFHSLSSCYVQNTENVRGTGSHESKHVIAMIDWACVNLEYDFNQCSDIHQLQGEPGKVSGSIILAIMIDTRRVEGLVLHSERHVELN